MTLDHAPGIVCPRSRQGSGAGQTPFRYRSTACTRRRFAGEQHLLKVYIDRSYVHTTTVRHQGITVALAMDDQWRLVYTVLDLALHDEKSR
ncbi:hypothetical protein OG974_04050 [Streptomyces sp. NBC_00597]|uniref:hypothetical protein n=1 Tax=unclassified Streptomyces TaxID=2593676 RepID=UPI002E122DF6|nr:hypothetical protein OG573_25690 [Streptomyces sp. NBC_01205]